MYVERLCDFVKYEPYMQHMGNEVQLSFNEGQKSSAPKMNSYYDYIIRIHFWSR